MFRVLDSFLEEHFQGLSLSPDFFSSWKHTLRFALGPTESEKERDRAIERASELFHEIFNENDKIFFVTDFHTLNNDSYLLRMPLNIYLKYLYHQRLLYRLRNYLSPYSITNDNKKKMHRYIVPCRKIDIRSQPLIESLLQKDDAISTPSSFENNGSSGFDVYTINHSKKIIFHLDHHVCTILATEKEQICSLHEKFHHWILADHDK